MPCPPGTSCTSGRAERSLGCRARTPTCVGGSVAAGDLGTGADLAARVERSLLGRPASMGRAEVSDGAGVEPATARRFWHAMGFQNVEDDEAMFTEADLDALKRVARLIGEDQVSEELALGMTRAFARTADRLAVWQTQLVAESLDLTLLRGARGTRQSLGARAPDRRGRRGAPRGAGARHRAAARLRLAPPPDERDRPHARRRRPGGALRPLRPGARRGLRRPRLLHLLRAPDERAPAGPPRPAVRAPRERRRDRARRPGHQDGGRRGAVRPHGGGRGIRHRSRPRRRDDRGRAAPARSASDSPTGGSCPASATSSASR